MSGGSNIAFSPQATIVLKNAIGNAPGVTGTDYNNFIMEAQLSPTFVNEINAVVGEGCNFVLDTNASNSYAYFNSGAVPTVVNGVTYTGPTMVVGVGSSLDANFLIGSLAHEGGHAIDYFFNGNPYFDGIDGTLASDGDEITSETIAVSYAAYVANEIDTNPNKTTDDYVINQVVSDASKDAQITSDILANSSIQYVNGTPLITLNDNEYEKLFSTIGLQALPSQAGQVSTTPYLLANGQKTGFLSLIQTIGVDPSSITNVTYSGVGSAAPSMTISYPGGTLVITQNEGSTTNYTFQEYDNSGNIIKLGGAYNPVAQSSLSNSSNLPDTSDGPLSGVVTNTTFYDSSGVPEEQTTVFDNGSEAQTTFDADGDPTLTTFSTTSAGTLVTLGFVSSSGLTPGSYESYGDVAALASAAESLGSNIGNAIAQGNQFIAVPATAVLSVALQNIANLAKGLPIGDSLIGNNIVNIGVEAQLENAFGKAGANAAGALVAGELIGALHLNGVPATLLSYATNVVVSAPLNALYQGALNDSWDVAGNSLEQAFQLTTVVTGFENFLGSFAGSELASVILPARTPDAAIGAEIGEIQGAIAGSFIPIPFVGTFIFSFIGRLEGELIGSLFGPGPSVGPDAIAVSQSVDGTWTVTSNAEDNGGETTVAASFADAFNNELNDVQTTIGGTLTNASSIAGTIGYGWYPDPNWIPLYGGANSDSPDGKTIGNDNPVFFENLNWGIKTSADLTTDGTAAASEALNPAAVQTLQDEEFTGANIYVTRALYNYQGSSVADLSADLSVASQYATYVANAAVINDLIENDPNSAFSLGWLLTLSQAHQLGLDNAGAIDHRRDARSLESSASTNPVILTANEPGNYEFFGGAGNDTIIGGSGDDVLEGGPGADSLDGGGGINTATYADAPAQSDDVSGVYVNLATGTGEGSDAQGDVLLNIQNLVGSAFNDTLIGGSEASILAGGAGDDSLVGGTGDAALDGGPGADTLVGGTGVNTAVYASSSEGVVVNLLTGTGQGGDAQGDVLIDIQNIVGSEFSDVLIGDNNANQISGGGGNDELIGNGGNDTLIGGSGNDTLDGGPGADSLVGGSGTAMATYWDSSLPVNVNLLAGTAMGGDATGDTLVGVEYLSGSVGDDTLTGDNNANLLIGNGGDDTLLGLGGNDTIDGGPGSDYMDGGAGNNTLDYAEATGETSPGVTVNLEASTVTGGDATGDTILNFQNAIGTQYDDVLTAIHGGSSLAGGDGNDTLVGDAGNDTLEGGAGGDLIEGGDGNNTAAYDTSSAGVTITLSNGNAYGVGGDAQGDTLTGIQNLTGSAFNDYLRGDGNNNLLSGGSAGDDTLVGGGGDDTMEGSGGTSLMEGGGGNDTYLYSLGDGIDTIQDAGGYNRIVFGQGIVASDVTVAVSGNNLVLGVDGVSNSITILNGLASGGGNAVQRFIFSDGTIWTLNDVERTLLAQQETAGNDTVAGINGTNELIDGSTGNDKLEGGNGDDTYIWNVGYGNDTIADSGGVNQVILGLGVTVSDVTVSQSADGNPDDVDLSYLGQTLTIVGQLSEQTISRFAFSDGTELTASAISQDLASAASVTTGAMITGSTNSDILIGTSQQGNIFDGLSGNDYEQGIGLQDVFVFNQGYGRLEIDETNTSANGTLQLGAGITESSLRVSATPDGRSLVLSIGTGSDQIIFDNALSAAGSGVQLVKFADGTAWTMSQVLSMETTGTAGPDTIVGSAGDDVIDGKGGDDYIQGNGGSDTYIFNQGYGYLEISQEEQGGATSILHFGAGISQSDITGQASVDGNSLLLHVGSGDDYVLLDDELSDPNAGVQYIQFNDGTLWSRQDFVQLATTGSAGNDTLLGGIGDALLDGKGGHDYVQGNGGSSIYAFNPGYGQLEINDPTGGADQSILNLGNGITSSEVHVTATPDQTGIVLQIGSTSDQIQLDGMLSNPNAGVEYVQFADGSSWSRTDILNQLLSQSENTGNDTIVGYEPGQLYDGLGGADYAQGQGGGDTFYFGAGYGSFEINETDCSGSLNALEFGPGITSSSITITKDQSNNIYITDGINNDVVQLDGMAGSSGRGAQVIRFADGTSLTAAQVVAMATSQQKVISPSNDFDYVVGEGRLDINLSSGNRGTLSLGSDLTAAQVSIHSDSRGNIIIDDGTQGDEVVVDNMLTEPGTGIQEILLSDGTTITASQILEMAATGTTGPDTIYGGGNNEVFDGKGGNDYIESSGSNETFLYKAGYGALQIDAAYTGGGHRILSLGSGISLSDLTVTGDANGNLLITDGVAGDSIKLIGMLSSTNDGVETVQFDDGSTLTRTELIAMATTGTAGSDRLYGTAGPNLFDGKGGNDYEQGNGGNDTFVYDPGYGSLEISEEGGGGQSVLRLTGVQLSATQLAILDDVADPRFWTSTPTETQESSETSDIPLSQLQVRADGHGNLIITDGVAGDRIVLDGMMGTPGDGVSEVQLADGTVIGAAQLLEMATTGTPGPDTLYGGPDAETFDGEGGGDYEQGSGGNDVFVYNTGYDGLEINEEGSGNSILQFGGGITPAEITARGDGRGNLIVTDGTTGDQITLDNMMSGASFGVQKVQFNDGVEWSRAQLLDLATTGTAGNDKLYGSAEPQVFNGEGGNDYELGNSGSDTFVYNLGYGTLEINDSDLVSQNVLQLGGGILPGSLEVSGTAAGNLVIADGQPGDQITLDGMLLNSQDGVQVVAFTGETTTLTREQLLTLATTGTTGADTLYGSSGGETFDGKGGDDYEQGNGGADTFVFNSGYGHLEINEENGVGAILSLGAGLEAGDVRVTTDQSGDVILTDGVAGDEVTIDGVLKNGSDGIALVQFASGQLWTAAQIDAAAVSASGTVSGLPILAGTAGPDTLYGGSGGDIFEGEGGNDVEVGQSGLDVFVYTPGDGHLEINENVGGPGTNDSVLEFGPGIMEADLAVTADSSGNIYISDGIAGDQIELDQMMKVGWSGQLEYGVAQVQFANGTTLSAQQLFARADTGTASNTVLYGTPGADVFDSRGYVTYEQGNGGTDSFIYNVGYGALEINEDAGLFSANSAVLALGAGITESDLVVTTDSSGNFYIGDKVTGDEIKLDQMLNVGYYGQSRYGVSQVQFADGTVWSAQQLIAVADTGTASNTVLYGTSGADVFDSRGYATYEQGNGGADTFIYKVNYGALQINEDAGLFTTNNAVLELGAGISESDISVTTDSSNNLYISDGVVGDQIKLEGMLNVGIYGQLRYGASQVQLTDGTIWSAQQLIALADIGTASNTVLYGTPGADVFDSRGYATYEQGNGGADTFTYNVGYGALEINEDAGLFDTNTATLDLGPGITESDITVATDSSGDLYITDGVAGDQVKLDQMLQVGIYGQLRYGIAQVVFSDGTIITANQLVDFNTTGAPGKTALYGTPNADVFDSRGYATYEQGNGGADIFSYNVNYGALEINEDDGLFNTDTATLTLGAGIDESNIEATTDSSNNLYISDGVAGDQIKLDGMLRAGYYGQLEYGVSQVQFADGKVWSAQQLIALADTGTASNTVLYGTPGADVFDTRGYATYERGNGGADTFIYNVNYGAVEINEDAGLFNTNAAALELGAGVSENDISVTTDGSNNLYINDGVAGDQIKLDGMLRVGYYGQLEYGVSQVKFADGTVWSAQQLIAFADIGTASNTVLYGTPGADVFDSRGYATYEQGNGGADSFIYNVNYGAVEIDEDAGLFNTNAAALELGAGVSENDISVTTDGSNNLYISDGVAGDQIKFDGMLRVGYYGQLEYGVSQVQFADGTIWSAQQLIAFADIGTASNTVLYGTPDADVFDSRGYATYEQGNGGADTFVYNIDYGTVDINEDAGLFNTNAAMLELGAGISEDDISVTTDGSNNLYISDGVAGDRIKLDGMIRVGYYGQLEYGVSQVQFADGTIWSAQQLFALADIGTASNTLLYGTPGADVFDSRGYATYEQGNGGADTFVYNLGYGAVEINEDVGGPNTNAATLLLGAGIAESDVSFSTDGSENLYMMDGQSGDQVKLDRMLDSGWYGQPEFGVGKLQFSDGTVWTQQQVAALATMGTTGSDTITGSFANEIFDGRGGNDTISGGTGSDTYIYRPGYGDLVINNSGSGGSLPQGQLLFASGLSEQNLWFVQSGSDLQIDVLGSANQITVQDWFGSSPSAALSQIQGGDGLKIDESQVQSLVTAMATFQSENSTFNPVLASGMPSDAALQSAIGSLWHA